MKFTKKIILPCIVSMFIFLTSSTFAQKKNTEEIKIKTSAECDMCKKRIEKALSLEPGVKKATLDVASKIVTVVYNPKKTTPDKIKKAITEAGYDADELPANNKAYQKLDDCCKKDSHTK